MKAVNGRILIEAVVKENKSGILMPKSIKANAKSMHHDFVVVSFSSELRSNELKELKVGDKIAVAPSQLIPNPLNENQFFIDESAVIGIY